MTSKQISRERKHHGSVFYAGYILAREHGKAPDEAARDAALRMEGGRR